MKSRSVHFRRGSLGRAGLAAALLAGLALPASAQAPGRMDEAAMRSMLASWPEASRKAADDMMKKYGPPNEVTATMLKWHDNGPWTYTIISNKEVPHRFPVPHPDVMEQAIDYRVPPEMFDDLAMYDGSVIVERTKGVMSARCDKEGANFLAINLAHDVATKRRTVADARAYYARAIMAFMKTQKMDPYMTKLQFPMQRGETGDPDKPAM